MHVLNFGVNFGCCMLIPLGKFSPWLSGSVMTWQMCHVNKCVSPTCQNCQHDKPSWLMFMLYIQQPCFTIHRRLSAKKATHSHSRSYAQTTRFLLFQIANYSYHRKNDVPNYRGRGRLVKFIQILIHSNCFSKKTNLT